MRADAKKKPAPCAGLKKQLAAAKRKKQTRAQKANVKRLQRAYSACLRKAKKKPKPKPPP